VQCPICAQPLEGGELVMVCHGCHKALGEGHALSLGATGEFRVPMPDVLTQMADDFDDPIIEQPRATNVCSWCGKLEAEVKKLLGRGGTALCNECVALASDIMEAELGAGWR
jgi:hypothetical protein